MDIQTTQEIKAKKYGGMVWRGRKLKRLGGNRELNERVYKKVDLGLNMYFMYIRTGRVTSQVIGKAAL